MTVLNPKDLNPLKKTPEMFDFCYYHFPRHFERFNKTHLPIPKIDAFTDDDSFFSPPPSFFLTKIRVSPIKGAFQIKQESATQEKVNSFSTSCFQPFKKQERKEKKELTLEESAIAYNRVKYKNRFCNPSNRLNQVTFLYKHTLE